MLFVHGLVFFYLPYKGNYNLHTSIECDQREMARENAMVKGLVLYECNSFTANWALIIFYLLYCWQF